MNYYEVLNVARGAETSDIKRAYFMAVKIHSPDLDPEGFKAVRLAFETLTDSKKRAEYDAYFAAPDELQNDLLAARELMRQNQYKQAVTFLTGLDTANPGSAEIKRQLVKALWALKKSGTADKICKELLEKDPSDCATLVLRARIAGSRGHTTKAEGYFEEAVKVSPLHAEAWIAYMRFALNDARWLVHKVFKRAMDLSEDMFQDDYILYLVGLRDILFYSAHKDLLAYFIKFTELFINDKNPDEGIYQAVMDIMPAILEEDDLIPFVEKILPALERSKHRRDEDEDHFKDIHSIIAAKKLRADKRIHDVLADLTGCLLNSDADTDDRLGMECYIACELPGIRQSIKVLRSDYPEYFKLNQDFYLDALNEKKTDFLRDKYYGIHKRLMRNVNSSEEYDPDDDIGTERLMPFVRETPKIGRNDPCPCGSGKKYKKCCG